MPQGEFRRCILHSVGVCETDYADPAATLLDPQPSAPPFEKSADV